MESQPANPPDTAPLVPVSIAVRPLGTRGYAGRFASLIVAGLGLLAVRDLREKEVSQILVCFGLNSIGWGWFWLVLGALLTWWLAGRISFNCYFLRVKEYKDPDPIDPREAGVVDISVWSFLLGYIATLFLAGLSPGTFGFLRPPAIVLVSMLCAFLLSAVLVTRTVRAIYGTSKVRLSISRHQCDMTSIKGRRCENWAFRSRFRVLVHSEQEFCRWHDISIQTAKRNSTRLFTVSFQQLQSAVCLLASFISLWSFVVEGGVVWLAVFIFTLGAAVRHVSDSIIAPWHVLSRFTIWAKLLTTGLVLEIVAGIAILILVGKQSERINPIVAFLGKDPDWLLFGPAIVYIFTTFLVAVAIDTLIRRIWLFSSSSFAPLLVLPTLLPIWNIVQSALWQHWLFSEWVSDQFWKAVIGGEVRKTWGLAFLITWSIPHSMFWGSRREYDSTIAAYATTLTNLFGPVLLSLLTLMASRYLLYSLGVMGSVAFIATAATLSLSLTLLWRRLARR